MIEYKMDENGGFYAADVDSHVIEYAYPTSDHAVAAKMTPLETAKAMLFSQSHITPETQQAEWMQERWSHMREQMLSAVPFSRFTDPAYIKQERKVARVERSIRRNVR